MGKFLSGRTIGWEFILLTSILILIPLLILKLILFFNGYWNIDMLPEVIPHEIVDLIIKIPIQSQFKDKILFNLSSTGNFSFKNLWEKIRVKEEVSHTYQALWHNTIPVSYSLLAWRCLKGYLPVDSRLWRKGFFLVSKCQCCANIESIQHIFFTSSTARHVWNHFCNFAGLDFFLVVGIYRIFLLCGLLKVLVGLFVINMEILWMLLLRLWIFVLLCLLSL
ncbi:uncharacterized protein LOC114581388 isoform X3 [Dendrobium catenatum]|uniref:uncharacterized protein LOC114581388 isoform X3 n=1 Tax=Dendrobium catenatum TaxID=906689 RepID=UPI00109FF0F0|nr:uncharacterized protein LOC114581388 isoform X3 [Dendrobium catenatum]